MDIQTKLSQEFGIELKYVQSIITLLDDGSTVPFIARYRKEATGNCDDQALRQIFDRLTYLRNLEKRKEEILKAIDTQGKLTPDIQTALANAQTLTEAEDVYRPFKQKKRTRASVAREKGLAPLAELILLQDGSDIAAAAKDYIDAEKGVETANDAISGAKDIISEIIADDAQIRKRLRNLLYKNGLLVSKLAKKEDGDGGVYQMYADYSEFIQQIKSHRILAVNRGEKEGVLKVKIETDKEIAVNICRAPYLKGAGEAAAIVEEAAADAYDRLIFPSVEREVRSELTAAAQEQAIKMFEVNLKPLLMQPPLKNKTVMGFDPGFRTGCKLAVVDQTGKVLDKSVIYPTTGKTEQAKKAILELIDKHAVDVIAIGNGTASKESEIFVAQTLKESGKNAVYTVVNEAGASVYSASELGAQEFPDFDVSERSAVSIARRLQDPLAELIKIDPKSIGVGQYQHDMDASRLDAVLTGVLEDCVNSVGVDLNTASAPLLKFVSGLNSQTAKNIVTFREQSGKFKSRQQLLKVAKLGAKAFEQCAGFLRITDGANVLDNTAVHPESYEKVDVLLSLLGYKHEDIKKGGAVNLIGKIEEKGKTQTASKIGLGLSTLDDILTELSKPGRDIRDSLPQPVLRSDLLSIEDLKKGMIISGTVRNVTDFGAFVDIGVHQDGLVHISKITDRYIKHPSEVLKVNQQVRVAVEDVDVKKGRISLTMKNIPAISNLNT